MSAFRHEDLPYRCPRCGDHRNFSTLQELKVHLEVEHPIVSSKKGRGVKLIDNYRKDAVRLEANRRAKSLDRERGRSKRPQLEYDIDSRDQNPSPEFGTKPRQRGHHGNLDRVPPPGGTKYSSANPKPAKHRNRYDPEKASKAKAKLAELIQQSPDLHLPSNINGMKNLVISDSQLNRISPPNRRNINSISSEDLNMTLYRDLIKPNETENGRNHIYVMADALLQARKHIDTLKQTAERVTNEQEKAISKLKQELKVKDHQLDRARRELYKLIAERRRLQRDVIDLSQTKDEDKEQLIKAKSDLQNQAELISLKEREVEDLTKYLTLVGEKESEAKNDLESFINGLLQRAQTAEEQLHSLQTSLLLSRAPSSDALDSPPKVSNPNSRELPTESQSDDPSNPENNPLNGGGNLSETFGGGLSSPKVRNSSSLRPALARRTHSLEVTPNGSDSDESLLTFSHDSLPTSPRSNSYLWTPVSPSLSVTPDPIVTSERPVPSRKTAARAIGADLRGFSPIPPGFAASPRSSHPSHMPRNHSHNNNHGHNPPSSSVISPLPDSGFGDGPQLSPGEIKGWFLPYFHDPLSPSSASGEEIKEKEKHPTTFDRLLSPLSIHIPDANAQLTNPDIHGATYLGPAVDSYSDVYESPSQQGDKNDGLPSDQNGIIWDDQYSPNPPPHRKSRHHRPSKNLVSPDSVISNDRHVTPRNGLHDTHPSKGNSWFNPHHDPDLPHRKSQRIPTPDWTSESLGPTDQRSSLDDISGTSGNSLSNYNPPPSLPNQLRRQRDALFCVSMYVDTKTLCQMSLVCREWLQVTRHPALWRRVALRHERISSKFLITISKWCTQLQSLTLEGLRGRPRRTNESNKTHKHSMRGSLELGVEHLFSVAHRTLVSLRVVNCGNLLTDRIIWLAGSKTQNLQRLAYISDTDPLGSEAIWSLAAGCQNLTTLIVPPSYPCEQPLRFNNRSVTMIAKCWPGMRVLCIGGPEVNVKGLVAVSKYCRDLQVLELDHMCEVTETVAMDMCDVGLAHLECVDFTFTPVTPKALLYFINACPRLRTINVHVGISDYFQDVSHPNHQQQYRLIVSKLQSLLRKPGLGGIIRLKTDYD